ncbi:hypothetical protein CPB84DRAFT_1855334 [Gymnopilus junonius]|uniref:Uncharacterized protein n=1 Tax=Gymnopilus junonius TaxID=109634 RepID=A0A9P5N6Z3_GYMJU|nr:hypothetical protein CPB84DRAFT_1855334 [Gymnopilus junonius]
MLSLLILSFPEDSFLAAVAVTAAGPVSVPTTTATLFFNRTSYNGSHARPNPSAKDTP